MAKLKAPRRALAFGPWDQMYVSLEEREECGRMARSRQTRSQPVPSSKATVTPYRRLTLSTSYGTKWHVRWSQRPSLIHGGASLSRTADDRIIRTCSRDIAPSSPDRSFSSCGQDLCNRYSARGSGQLEAAARRPHPEVTCDASRDAQDEFTVAELLRQLLRLFEHRQNLVDRQIQRHG